MASNLDRFADWIEPKMDEEAREIFSDKVIAECFDPRNMERLTSCDAKAVFQGPCGDTMEFYLLLDGETISHASFMTDGCGATVACGSMLSKIVKGVALEDAVAIEGDRLRDVLDGLPADHNHCADLAVLTLRKAIEKASDSEERASC